MQKEILKEIKSNYDFMSVVEKKIADFILLDKTRCLSVSLSEFASGVNVSQGSVINFCNKFVGGGFPDLKICLATEIAKGQEKEIDDYDLLRKREIETKKAFANTISQNKNDIINIVSDKILSAKKVEIYGLYKSAVVATDFYYQLMEMGIPSNFVNDVLMCAVSASYLEKSSIVVAISSSGMTKDIIDATRLAKANGVEVVCITANKNSQLAKLSDYVLVASSSGINEFSSSLEVRLSQLLLIDTISENISKKLKQRGKYNKETMNKILSSHNIKD